MLDLLLIHPGAAHGIYGALGDELTAVEPPLWCRLIAGYCRDRGFSVAICDAEAQGLNARDVAAKVASLRPRLVVLAVYGHQPSASTQQMHAAGEIAREIKARSHPQMVMMVGGHVAALPERTLREERIDFACTGEGPITIVGLLSPIALANVPGLVWWREVMCERTLVVNEPAMLIENMRDLHGDAWDLLPMKQYRAHNWQCFGDLPKRKPYASIYTSLGCPYKCLAGDVEVNTLYGKFPIKALAECFGDRGVPVYTHDPRTGLTFIADGVRIRKYGEAQELVRVRFDDGTHIDCTPDHLFLQFKWGNGKSESSQRECQASDLVPGAHVRALRFEAHAKGRVYVTWARRARRFRSRMVMEYLMGRSLTRGEQVHHEDRDHSNDHPSNLEFCNSAKEHFALHPEIAERMRKDNPTKNGMPPEWREEIGRANRGKVRSPEQRARYRASKLGEKNLNYRHGQRVGVASRLEVNHRVTAVERLAQRGDVYCLTVPETGWFYANDVLVKNCSFCCINAPFASNRYRMRDPADVVREIAMLHSEYGVSTFKIIDEMFVLNEQHYGAIAEGLVDIGDRLNIWAYARVDTVRTNMLPLLRNAGFRWLALGIESESEHVRDGANKRMRTSDIEGVVREIQAAGINVIANYIFGLPDDDATSMAKTLLLAGRLNTEFANFYSAMAYPGSALYTEAVLADARLPATWRGYSQHNDECMPLDTKHVSAENVLRFRDAAFRNYFSHPRYQDMIASKFGPEALAHVRRMLEYKLPRKLLEAA